MTKGYSGYFRLLERKTFMFCLVISCTGSIKSLAHYPFLPVEKRPNENLGGVSKLLKRV